jgi:DNA invertase Pin-like site-specific DNA recombinase
VDNNIAKSTGFAHVIVDSKSVSQREGTLRKIGYARVSSTAQNLDRQIGALRAERCDEIFREKASGKDVRGRPQLEKAIDSLGTGDVLVLAEWDRCTRSMMDGVAIIERIHSRGALVKVLDKPHLDLTTPIGRGFIAFLSALAEDERQRIVKRANDGRKVAKDKGVRFGRKPKLTDHQQAEALKRLESGESCRQISKTFEVSHVTISRLARVA